MRRITLAAVLGLTSCAASPSVGFEIRMVDDAVFEVVARDPRAFADVPDWRAMMSVYVADAGDEAPQMLGKYELLAGSRIRFTPRFGLDHGVRYRVVSPSNQRIFTIAPSDAPRVRVAHVYPSGDVLPENLLRFYVQFTGPVAKGDVYRHIKLLDHRGKPLGLPFIEIAEELWNPAGTRLTLLLDPGRIKNELRPRLEDGPVLHAGRKYTLTVDAKWPDSFGRPLLDAFSKKFRTGPVDSVQPAPKKWTLSTPRRGSKEPLEVRFPGPLDHALLHRMLDVHGPDGEPVDGEIEVLDHETLWRFRPGVAWRSGQHDLIVDTDLEDQVGNSIRAPFEVDVVRVTTRRIAKKTVRLPIALR